MAIQIAICGPRECTDDDRRNAHELGRLLAERGAVVICGGYTGVMAAASAGANAAGGTVVGVLSRADREGSNPDLSIVIPTGAGEARNNIIVNSGDAVIIVGGSWGTLSELALAMRRRTSPVIQISGWQILDQHGRPVPGIQYAANPREALALTGLWL